jgi:hypothetical protein
MEYRAAAAVPLIDPGRAISGLRGQLRILADVDHAIIDWPSLQVAGPVEVVGARGQVWYEWTATARAIEPSAQQDSQPVTIADRQ